jgi:hypothetical protein
MNGKIDELLKKAEKQKEDSGGGKSSVTQAERAFSNEVEAAEAFRKLREKLYDVNSWETDSGVSAFQLFDATGRKLDSAVAETGSFIRINLPGSGKNDWVRIVDIHDSADEVVVTVQPSFDPTAEEKDKISHFFKSKASNNFCLGRDGARLVFYVIGLDEEANTDETGGIIESARNLATAYAGWLGFQKIEWKTFCENFLNNR